MWFDPSRENSTHLKRNCTRGPEILAFPACGKGFGRARPPGPPLQPMYPAIPSYTQLYPPIPDYTQLCPAPPSSPQPYPAMPSYAHLYPAIPTYTQLYPAQPSSTHLYPASAGWSTQVARVARPRPRGAGAPRAAWRAVAGGARPALVRSGRSQVGATPPAAPAAAPRTATRGSQRRSCAK